MVITPSVSEHDLTEHLHGHRSADSGSRTGLFTKRAHELRVGHRVIPQALQVGGVFLQ